MIRTNVFFRPDKRDADLVRAGTVYLSRTSDKLMAYVSFMPDEQGVRAALESTSSEAMKIVLNDFATKIHHVVQASDFSKKSTEEEVIEAAFRLLPTNFKHDKVETYPAEDFFVQAVLELEETRKLKASDVVREESVAAA